MSFCQVQFKEDESMEASPIDVKCENNEMIVGDADNRNTQHHQRHFLSLKVTDVTQSKSYST